MNLGTNFKKKAAVLKSKLTVLYYAYRNPKTSWIAKGAILLALGYVLSPIDLIPDFIPILGYLDDLLIVPLLITLSIALLSPEVLRESEERAASEPLILKKKWFFALFILSVWLLLLLILLKVFRIV
jgi:uncharacterized membrane protein YkvA (DUF1232 family)